MRRNLALPLAALMGAAAVLPMSVAAFSAPSVGPVPSPSPSSSIPDPSDPGPSDPGPSDPGPSDPGPGDPGPSDPDPDPDPDSVAERYGVVRYDTAARTWTILSSPVFESSGLTGVTCSRLTGVLTVGFDQLSTIGTFTVDEDDAYAGRYAAGAAATTKSLAITFRKPFTGAVVPCNAAELRIKDSSLQLWVRGTSFVPPSPPPTKPAPGPTQSSPQTSTPPPPEPSSSRSNPTPTPRAA